MIKSRIYLAIFIIPLGLIIAAVPQNTTHPYKLTANQLLELANSNSQFVSPDEVADMLIQKDPDLQLIDVRSPDEFDKFSLPGAINIPLTEILSEDYRYLIDQDIKMNVFYSNGSLHSNEAWMISSQLGYKNNYVLQGGLNYWAETIMNPSEPSSTSPDEEIAKYDFRKGASMSLGGGITEAASAGSSDIKMPPKPIIKKDKKKRVQGGC